MSNWRPHNETATDRSRQDAARDLLAQAWRCKIIDLSPNLYELDWAIIQDDKLVAWAEYKHRSRRYDTVLLSYAKWHKGVELARSSGEQFIFVVEWPDHGLHWVRVDDLKLKAQLGFNSRGQRGDEEPVVFIDVELFQPLIKKKEKT